MERERDKEHQKEKEGIMDFDKRFNSRERGEQNKTFSCEKTTGAGAVASEGSLLFSC